MPKKKTDGKPKKKKQKKKSGKESSEEDDALHFEPHKVSDNFVLPPLPRIGPQSISLAANETELNVDGDPQLSGGESEPLTPEQQQVAQFWAEEELNGPRGWEDDAEVTYSPTTPDSEQLRSSTPFTSPVTVESRSAQGEESIAMDTFEQAQGSVSEVPSLFNYSHSVSFEVKYLGELHTVSAEWLQSGAPAEFIKLIELSQRQGRIPWVPYTGCERILFISKYGLKVTDSYKKRVYMRLALHNVVSVIHYESTQKTSLLAIRTSKGADENFDLSLFECESEEQATEICSTLTQAFETVLTKIRLEQNLIPTELS